ncbi:MAG TPA: hypothetical protein VNR87_13510, partial [Flavisolibacter sp.]|nr:hypothetical protein [Flavisolibacter sp.]
FLMGILCITSAHDLVNTVLGKRISFGLAVFWLARLIIQFLGYSSTLWRGKALETAVHMLLSLFWLYLTTVFILSYFA